MTKQTQAFDSDPSMDDILSSIRNIISDDVKKASGSSKPSRNRYNQEVDTNVLELTQALNDDGTIETIKREDPMAARTKKSDDALDLTEAEEIPSVEEEKGEDTPPTPEEAYDIPNPDLISQGALNESIEALQGLDSISDATLKEAGAQFDSSKTVETLMIDILRPMLKEWIAANLPSLVKVIVNEQVEKVMQARLGIPANQSISPEEEEVEEENAPQVAGG